MLLKSASYVRSPICQRSYPLVEFCVKNQKILNLNSINEELTIFGLKFFFFLPLCLSSSLFPCLPKLFSAF